LDLAFCPDSRALATLIGSNQIWLWNVADLRQPVSQIDTEGLGIAFSHDGRLMAAGSELWDISDIYHPRAQGALIGYPPRRVQAIAFGAEDGILALTDNDSTVMGSTGELKDTRQFNMSNYDDLASLACRHVQIAITKIEWNQYFPGIEYQPPCA
jgi:hypothetical protein